MYKHPGVFVNTLGCLQTPCYGQKPYDNNIVKIFYLTKHLVQWIYDDKVCSVNKWVCGDKNFQYNSRSAIFCSEQLLYFDEI